MHPAVRSTMIGAGIIGALVAGGATASFAASSANSATTQSDTSTTDQTATDQSTVQAPAQGQQPPDQAGRPGQRPGSDGSKAGHTADGKTEELLTGDTATKVTDAALAAVPGATIERVETDADGAAYEAHLVTSDGKHQTVTFDADFNVVEIQDCAGGGPGGMGGGPGRRGGAPGQRQDGTAPAAPGTPADGTGGTSTTAGS